MARAVRLLRPTCAGCGGCRSGSGAIGRSADRTLGGVAVLCGIRRGQSLNLLVVVRSDDVAGLLGNTVGRHHQMRREGDGRHTGIGHADVGQPIDAEVRVDDTSLRQRQHRTGGRRVEFCKNVITQEIVPLVIGLDVLPGIRLLDQTVRQRFGLSNATHELHTLAEDRDICGDM